MRRCRGWYQVTGNHQPRTHGAAVGVLLLCQSTYCTSLCAVCRHAAQETHWQSTLANFLCMFKGCSVPPPPPLEVVGGDIVPYDGSDVGIKLGHQDTRSHNEDVQCQNMEEAKTKKTTTKISVDVSTPTCPRQTPK